MNKFICLDATAPSKLNLGRMTNHGKGKQQNAKMKIIDGLFLCLHSLKKIEAREEILYDYGINELPWRHRSGKKVKVFKQVEYKEMDM